MMKWTSTAIGYPYIGDEREWKRCLEAFWKGDVEEDVFLQQLKDIRLGRLKRQKDHGLDYLSIGDFTMYDRMLDTAFMFGMIPSRYGAGKGEYDLSVYFAMARKARFMRPFMAAPPYADKSVSRM